MNSAHDNDDLMAMQRKKLGDLLAGNIILRSLNIACSVLITLLLTRLLGTSGYGLLSLLVANATLLSLFTCLGAESGIIYHYSSNRLQRSPVLSITYLVLLFQLLVLFAVETIYHYYTGRYWLLEGDSGTALLWGIIYFFSIATIDKYIALLNAAHLYTLANKITLAINIVTLLIFLYCAVWWQTEIQFYLKVFIVCSVLQAISLIFFFHYRTRQSFVFGQIGKKDWRLFFSYSAVVLITNITQFLAYRADYWIVDYYHGKDQLGLYSFAVKLGQMLWILPLLMAGILFPRIAGKVEPVEEEKWIVLIRILVTVFLIVSVIGGIAAIWVIPFLAGESFTGSVLPFIFLLPGLLFFCFNIIFAAYFAGTGKLLINLRGSFLCLVIVLIADFLLIPWWGIQGAAVASSLAYTVAGMHHLWVYTRYKRIPAFSVMIARRRDWNMAGSYLKKYFPWQ